ncbi:hypothetical protein STEG23_036235, partial [Scotinomys teguina]
YRFESLSYHCFYPKLILIYCRVRFLSMEAPQSVCQFPSDVWDMSSFGLGNMGTPGSGAFEFWTSIITHS